MNTKSIVLVTAMGIFIAVVMTIGLLASRVRQTTFVDFAVGSRKFGVLVVALSTSATVYSAYVFLGFPGIIAQYGMGGSVNLINNMVIALGAWILGRRLWILGRKYGYVTLPDMLGDYYGTRSVRLLAGLAGFLFTVPYVGSQMVAAGYLFEVLTDGAVPLFWGVIGFFTVALVYVYLGGMRAVAWTDVLQAAVMWSCMLLGCYVVAQQAFGGVVEGFSGALERAPEQFTAPGGDGFWTWQQLIAFWVLISGGLIVAPHTVLRYYVARSLDVLKWGMLGFGLITSTIYILVPVIGLAGSITSPGTPPDRLWPSLLVEFSPIVLAAVLLAGAFSAMMSTADSQLHAVSIIAIRDLYQPLAPNSVVSERRLVLASKALILVVGVVSLMLALGTEELIVLVVAAATGGWLQLLPPTIGALWWRRASAAGAVSGLAVGLPLLLFFEAGVIEPVAGFPGAAVAFAVNAAIFIIVSVATRSPDHSRVDKVQHYPDRVLEALRAKAARTEAGPARRGVEARS